MCAALRSYLAKRFGEDFARATRVIYCGSVKPANARDLMGQPDVDGALVGGASIVADDFTGIVRAAL